MLVIKKLKFCVILLIFLWQAIYAEEFVINKIYVNGLKRISLETVLSNLTVGEGDVIDSSQTGYIIRDLYKTKFFSNINLKRVDNNLIIDVVEREVIGSIKFFGNNKITKKQMSEILKNIGLVEGQAIDAALLSGFTNALIQEYKNLGLYNAKVTTSIKKQERNRVAVTINISEGPVAKIKSIRIVGNKAFKEKTLLRGFSLTTRRLWSYFTRSDQYSKIKLDADLENLQYFYMDHGYLHFKVDSTDVKMSSDKKNIYIKITIDEGLPYTIKGFLLDVNLPDKRNEILKLIAIKPGDIFSRKNVIDIQSNIAMLLGDYGYGMPTINIEPIIDEKHKQITVKFIIDVGHRVYVHLIGFSGNVKTHDKVLRREMRLQEGSLFSLSKINESKRRLSNLKYLQDVEYKVTPMPEYSDQVDLNYSMKEISAIEASANCGFSDAEGFLYGAHLSDSNFMGTGKTTSIGFTNTKITKSYMLGYYDPYFTENNIGLALNGYFQKRDPGRKNLSAYSADTYGGSASFSVPLSDYTQANFGVGFEHIKLHIPTDTAQHILDFVNQNGYVFNQFKLMAGLVYSNFDRGIFPTKGFSHGIDLQGYLPVNSKSLKFYIIDYNASFYQPLIKDFIFHAYANVGYGNSYGKTKELPFFKNFFAGGIGTVRGFESDAIGDQDKFHHAKGGNILTVASASIIIPSPINDVLRPSVFIDVGSVYNNKFRLNELRSSYGVQVEWRTPIVPLLFSFGFPIHKKPGDDTSKFQFTISFSTQ